MIEVELLIYLKIKMLPYKKTTIFIAALCALTTFRASSETIYLGNSGETSKNWTSNNLKKQYKGNTPTKFSLHGW